MRLHTRVLLAQLPALVVVVLLLLVGGATVERLAGQGRAVLGDNYRSVVAAQRMNESIERLDSAALFCLAQACDQGAPLVAEHLPRFEAELRVEEGNITEPGEAEAARALRAAWTGYRERYEAFLAAPPESMRALYFQGLLPQFREVKAATDRVLALNQDAMVAKADASEILGARAQAWWLGGSAVGLLTALALGSALTRRLVEPLRQFAAAAAAIGDGQLGARLPASPVLELDAVVGAFNQMAERLRRYRRTADSELVRTREAAQAAIESLVDPVVVLTVRGEVRATNAAAREALRVDPGSRRLGGQAADAAGLLEAVDGARRTVVETGRPVLPRDFTSVVTHAGPEAERAYLVHATPVHDPVTAELVGVTVLLQDVTRLRHLDALKGDLVRTVAHELRTPLTSLGMALHLALDERLGGALPPARQELLEAAREDVARLRALVEDLLDLSRLQRGLGGGGPEPMDPLELLGEVAAAVRAAATAARVEVVVEGAPVPIRADRARLRMAVLNLATNAVRHSPAGGRVWLRVRADDGAARFEVEDEGPGVPEEEATRIFDPYVRGADARGEGAGLGLTIAQEVARAHGGYIRVERAPGGGARFALTVPEAPDTRQGGG